MGSTATTPKVAVNKAGKGFVVPCSQCPKFRANRQHRLDADITATGHVRSQTRETYKDEED